ncbi:MAG: hypothetical protein SNJ70_02510 [Armatimonadota bacterium]
MKRSIILFAILMMAISASSVFALSITGTIDTLINPTYIGVGQSHIDMLTLLIHQM